MPLAPAKTVCILDVLARKGECELDELVLLCQGLGWHQIFLEVDRLSREGHVRLIAKGCGIYVVSLTTLARENLQQPEQALC
jgi:hypothetical protein